MRTLVGLLRVADALDRSRAGLVSHVTMGDVTPGDVQLVVATVNGAELELSEAQRRSGLLVRSLGRRLVVRPATAVPVAGAAGGHRGV